MAAIFYVFGGPAMFSADGTDPSRDGLPIYPGGNIILVGRMNIANARWSNMDPGSTAMITVLFYDQVDIIAADMGTIPANVPPDNTAAINQILLELKKIRTMTEFDLQLDAEDFNVA